jgi:hypothetical protein
MSTIHNREGEWVFQLIKDGVPYAERSLTCGTKTALDAIAQWKRNGFQVVILRRPSKER